jgi:hypothetical protein
MNPDDVERMDLQWGMAMLVHRVQNHVAKTDNKNFTKSGTIGFDKKKVRCYNCQQLGIDHRETSFWSGNHKGYLRQDSSNSGTNQDS